MGYSSWMFTSLMRDLRAQSARSRISCCRGSPRSRPGPRAVRSCARVTWVTCTNVTPGRRRLLSGKVSQNRALLPSGRSTEPYQVEYEIFGMP